MAMSVAWLSPCTTISPYKFNTTPRRFSCCSAISSQADLSTSTATTSSTIRPAVILPGLGNNSNDYEKLALILKDYGVPTAIAKVSRIDWLRNAAGLLDTNYWRGTLRPRPVLDWYLKRIDEAISQAKELAQGGNGTLSFIGHSAGGWLARVYLQEFGSSDISLLLTLGTPHQYIQGSRFFDSSSTYSSEVMGDVEEPMTEVAAVSNTNAETLTGSTFRTRFVGQGYKQVCGQADVWGDGVVPEVSAHLKGALNVTLDGVYHSPVGSDDATRPWYGSPAVVEHWIRHLLV
ncbi:uncharacterized protein LOC132063478 isoform X2 [Lycium ferocissimum]|uniref:uncharacterized protein LOC132063478 isoform X2 n=1 Tax=Lycium ferocissimum TaxID=112874 RepID=UPI002814E1F4|nr:uncharacterized protein LOC132063478 isoform X2 [Lycium ferocissimum]